MKTAYNMLWVSPGFQASGPALSSVTRDNVLKSAALNPDADVMLWVDAKRLTDAQMTELKALEQNAHHNNLRVRDLRSIPDVATLETPDGKRFFDIPNDAPRSDKHGVFWRQVDVARILATRHAAQEGYDQVFYADADIPNLRVVDPAVQDIMQKRGVMLCAGWVKGGPIENQAFALTKDRAELLEPLVKATLLDALKGEVNGFTAINYWAKSTVAPAVGIAPDEIASLCFTPAPQPKPVNLTYKTKKPTARATEWSDDVKRDGWDNQV